MGDYEGRFSEGNILARMRRGDAVTTGDRLSKLEAEVAELPRLRAEVAELRAEVAELRAKLRGGLDAEG